MREIKQEHAFLGFETAGKGMTDITADVSNWIRLSGIENGLVTLLCQHTSASLMINENAAPAVQRDLMAWFEKTAPEGDDYEHDDEGPDDMPAHIRSMVTGDGRSIPVLGGKMMLGTWQGIYLVEHRASAQKRHVAIHIIGETSN